MRNRWVVVIIALVGILTLLIGVKVSDPAFVHSQSTTLCLSCMGLV